MTGEPRAVSDTIGFVIVFSMVIAVVGLAFAGGLPALESVRDVERVDNAERAFDILAENLDDVQSQNAPSRATEIKLADASLALGEPVTVNVTGLSTVPGRSFSTEYTTRPIVFEAADSAVVYSMGAVFRQEPGGTAALRSPPLVATSERVVLPVLVLQDDGGTSVGGSTTVLIRTDRAATRVLVAQPNSLDRVYMNVTSPRATAWARDLESASEFSCSVSGDTARCSVQNVARTYVSLTEVDVAFE